MRPVHAVWASLALLALWVIWAACFNTAQFGDNVEQYNWAQSLELGYHKHPPLPSWLLAGLIKLWGPNVYWAYGLAGLCLAGTALFTWSLARPLIGDRAAAAAIVLWGLNQAFSERAQLYNHNTVLVLCVSASAWLALHATRATRWRYAWWLMTGLAGGAAMLSKYQALVPLAGILVAAMWTQRASQVARITGPLVAVAAMVIVCTPHAVWVANHDFSTLRYAADAIESSNLWDRLRFLVAFAVNQARMQFPAMLAVALCCVWSVRSTDAIVLASEPEHPDRSVWMFGVVGIGLLALAVMALAGGVSLRNHWGVQALQFVSLWVAYHWDRVSRINLRRLIWVAFVIHGLSLAWYATEHSDSSRLISARRIDTMYPARRLAHAAVSHWSSVTQCPLRYVSGTMFDAGLVSLYSGSRLQVFDSASATPWVDGQDMRVAGALYVLDEHDAVPAGVTDIIEFDLVQHAEAGHPSKIVKLGIMPPQHDCS